MREVGGNQEESVSRRRWSLMSRAAERFRKMWTERCPLDLAMCGPLVTLTGLVSEGGSQLGGGFSCVGPQTGVDFMIIP